MVNTPLLYKFLKAFGPQSPSLRVLQDIEACPTESLDLDFLISDAQGLDLATFKVPTSFKRLLESFTYYMASCHGPAELSSPHTALDSLQHRVLANMWIWNEK